MTFRQFLSWLCDPRDDMFPRLPFLCPPLVGNFVSFDIRFQFSNVDRIGNFHHQNRPHSVQTCPQGRAGKRKGGGGGLRNQSMSIFVLHARSVLSIISVKNAPAVKKAAGGKEWQARLGCLLDAWLGRGHAWVCVCDSSIPVPYHVLLFFLCKTFAIKAVAESGESACKVEEDGGEFFFSSDFSTVCRLSPVAEASLKLFICLLCLLLAPSPPQQLSTLGLYTRDTRHNELSRLSPALSTAR